jgi:hypothetical protein
MDGFDRDAEIGRLLDLLPASSRMKLRVIPQPHQTEVLTAPFPWPWRTEWPVSINFQLWQNLTEPQRDLLFCVRTAGCAELPGFVPVGPRAWCSPVV